MRVVSVFGWRLELLVSGWCCFSLRLLVGRLSRKEPMYPYHKGT